MKNAFWICLALVSLKGCAQDFRAEALEEVSYTASTRGYFYEVVATPTLLSIRSERGEAQPKTLPMPEKDWQALIEEVRKLDLHALEYMDTQIEGSSTDRVAMAEVSIRYDGEEFISPTFDDGTPPKALKGLVNKMLGWAGSVERQ